MGQSSKAKHVSFEDVKIDDEAEKYVTISEEEIRTVVQKEKRNKIPKRKMATNVSRPDDDEDIVYVEKYMLTSKKKKY